MWLCATRGKVVDWTPGNPIVVRIVAAQAALTNLRDKKTRHQTFVREGTKLSRELISAASKFFPTVFGQVTTPNEVVADGILIRQDKMFCAGIKRASRGIEEPLKEAYMGIKTGAFYIHRDEKTLTPIEGKHRLPSDLSAFLLNILADPMLATGGSACLAVRRLKERGAQRIIMICWITCPEGLKRLWSEHPDVMGITAAIDPALNSKGYIMPGLGDAGNRWCGWVRGEKKHAKSGGSNGTRRTVDPERSRAVEPI